MHTLLTVFCIIFALWLWVVWFTAKEPPARPTKKYYPPTVPRPIYITKEQDFLNRVKQIKALVEKGKYDKALALLKRLEVLDNIPSNTNVIPVNSGRLKE